MEQLLCSALDVLLSNGTPLRLEALQSISQCCRATRALVASMQGSLWRRSAQATVPAWHPLLRDSDVQAGQCCSNISSCLLSQQLGALV